MGRDVATCLRDAERFHREGQRAKTIKRLEEALRGLRNPPQELPSWVKVGARLMWASSFKQTVEDTMVVDEVHRENLDRWFKCVRKDAEGAVTSVCVVERSTGKRHWKRYVP